MKPICYYICWPEFDRVCLQGGCLYCKDKDVVKTSDEIIAALDYRNEIIKNKPITRAEAVADLEDNTNRRVK